MCLGGKPFGEIARHSFMTGKEQNPRGILIQPMHQHGTAMVVLGMGKSSRQRPINMLLDFTPPLYRNARRVIDGDDILRLIHH